IPIFDAGLSLITQTSLFRKRIFRVKIDNFESSQTPSNGTYLNFTRYHFGINYWLKEHAANIKLEYLVDSENGKINGANAKGQDAATVQFQILL
ncbi:MAG: hypothetical protein ACP5JP_07020, partial [bacterium]